jgi:hypothetical protein
MMMIFRRKQNYVKKNTEAVLDASKEVTVEVNTEKSKCLFTSRQRNTGQNHVIDSYLINASKM